MNTILGISPFGLQDGVAFSSNTLKNRGFFLADAVLPRHPMGQIRTGQEAEEERIHTGIFWPPEARIQLDSPLRRAPIPYLWKALVEAGDSGGAKWRIGDNITFPVHRILATHVTDLINSLALSRKNDNDCETDGYPVFDSFMPVVAIPDNLDEVGQEFLLKEFNSMGLRDSRLIWRPVAAAFSWLDHLGDELTLNPGQDNHIHVIYMGPDALEFTTLRLMEREYHGKKFILPLRDRPTSMPSMTGMDWVAGTIERNFNPIDPGAFWQAFTSFPETWQAVAGIHWEADELPRPWWKAGQWIGWNPTNYFYKRNDDAQALPSIFLRRILEKSCPLKMPADSCSGSMKEALYNQFHSLMEQFPQKNLKGVILCGPLAPEMPPLWLKKGVNDFYGSRFNLSDDCHIPRPHSLWICPQHLDAVSLGANIYGSRIKTGQPTYMDVLPGMSLFTVKNNWEQHWENIVKESTCEGGKTYIHKIKNLFFLDAHSDKMEVYLKKEGTVSPYRKGFINFPTKSTQQIPLDIDIEMRPAGGLARIKITPQEKKFLNGRSLFFDYSKMSHILKSDLPQIARAWPELVQIQITEDPDAYNSSTFRYFMDQEINSYDYLDLIKDVKQELSTGFSEDSGQWAKKIDQNGIAGSKKGLTVIHNIANKIGADFDIAVSSRKQNHITQLIIGGSRLWLKTPNNLIDYLVHYFMSPPDYVNPWNWYVEAASRSFNCVEDFNVLFSAIYDRLIRVPPLKTPFPINAMRAIWQVLIYRSEGPSGLDRKMAIRFIKQAVNILESQVEINNFKKLFFQSIFLFLLLLRYRKVESDFMSPENKKYRVLFQRTESCLDDAITRVSVHAPYQADRIKDLLKKMNDYMYFKGAPGLIHQLQKEAGE